jgi:hypothetical protein
MRKVSSTTKKFPNAQNITKDLEDSFSINYKTSLGDNTFKKT